MNNEFNRRAINPIQCLSDGYEMLKGSYGSFLSVLIVAGLIIIVGSCIPLAPLLPPMICGIYLCLFAAMNRQPFNTGTLFKGFDFFGQSFLASLVTTIPIFVLSFVMQIGLGGVSAIVDTMKAKKDPQPEDVIPILVGVFGFLFGMYLLIISVAIVLGTLTAFVYPLIVDRKLSAVAALKLSFRAVMGNFFGVIGLMILGQLIILAGLMFFYVGALFVAPVIFAAWAIAYRRVFPMQIQTAPQQAQFGAPAAPQYTTWTPPVTASKAGWVLTLGAFAVIGLGIAGFAAIGYFAYQGITNAIQKVQEERERREISGPTPPRHGYPTPTPYQTPATNNPPSGKTISGGVLNGKATNLPKPAYPSAARAVRASGAVNVQVTVNENGSVVSARAVSGHPLLRQSAEQAARDAKFSPTLLGGKAVKVSGVIVYNFVPE